MKQIKHFITGFIQRSGSHIFIATLISKLFSFIGSWIALMILPDKELGLAIFAFNIISFLIPLGGLGVQQSLLRYGSFLPTCNEKLNLYNITIKKGVKWSVYLIILTIIFSPIITYKLKDSIIYLILLSVSILSYFLFEISKIKFRITYNNKMFALMDITFSSIQILNILILSYYFGVYGYVFAIVLSPLVTFLIFKSKDYNYSSSEIPPINFINKDFWMYGFFAGLANVATQLLFAIDIILIGYLLIDPQLVTHYKYVGIIPFSLLILPNILITTDFVSITENVDNPIFIKNYIKNFTLLFSFISIFIFGGVFFFGKYILRIFGENYTVYYHLFMILTIGVIGVFILRSLFGNLLSAIGKAHLNFWIACVSLISNIILNYYFIPIYGILGAGMTSAIIMWFSGILSMLLFLFYYKRYLKGF
ncbi:MAG: polysaccharide biosynthesis C-terminal domain-containing protein [Flavobacteriaceae bacterium]|nr:polysaccharide biosynthesis C-terminal domain-containing protein [Flavobacteriaceae bacterium]